MMLSKLFYLISQMPSGLPDPEAYNKLGAERQEFLEAETPEERLEEAVDRAYYSLKEIFNAAHDVGVSVDHLMVALEAKVSYRLSNPKNKQVERFLMVEAVNLIIDN